MAESISVAPEGQQQPQLQGIFAGGQQPPLGGLGTGKPVLGGLQD